jgi:hypothetical protein
METDIIKKMLNAAAQNGAMDMLADMLPHEEPMFPLFSMVTANDVTITKATVMTPANCEKTR